MSSKHVQVGIAAAMAVAFSGVLWLTGDLIGRVDEQVKTAEHQRNSELVYAAFASAKVQLAQIAIDNSFSDDAVRYGYGFVNRAKLADSFGSVTSKEEPPYDTSFILDGVTHETRFAFQKGKPLNFTIKAQSYLAGTEAPLIAAVPKDGETAGVATGFVKTPDGLAVVAVSPIVPSSNAISVSQVKPNYLILVRHFTPAYIEQLGKVIAVKNIKVHASNSEDGVMLRDSYGTVTAKLDWEDEESTGMNTGTMWQRASLSLAMLLTVMVGIAKVCFDLFRRLMRKEEEARIEAMQDPLTKLPNRKALISEIATLRENSNNHFAIAFADLDGFKVVNDCYGHQLGDSLIRTIANGIALIAPNSHMQARMGGDEFVVLFIGENAVQEAKAFAQSMIDFVAQPFDFEGRIVAVGASVGIASTDGPDCTAADVLRRADIAMYRAKEDGKNRWCEFDPVFDLEREQAHGISVELREILDKRSLEIAFQPLVDAKTGAITSVEALARWPRSSQRKVSPDKFINIAETTGLIDDLGQLILEKACIAAKLWGNLRFAINLSPNQLNHPEFVERTLRTINEHGVDPRRVEFEVTETVLIKDFERAGRVFERLRQAGIRIALDDFGVGYSSIGYLRKFAFDRIKIDRSITSCIMNSKVDHSILLGIVQVARSLSADVTAEGVETSAEVGLLQLTGCTELQGFYFHRPMSAESVNDLLVKPESETISEVALVNRRKAFAVS